MSKIMQSALDPSCLMCYTPLGWWSPLRQGVVWPGSPRNFATEPEAAWREFYRASSEIGVHDYIRTLIVRIDDTDGIIWGDTAGQSVFYAERTGQSIRLCMQPGTANYGRIAVDNVAAGSHTIMWQKTGNSASYSFDGVEIFSAPSVAGNTQWTTRAMPRSSTGTILSDTLRDASSGRIVWSYPSEAERLRLITSTNVRVDRGYFEAADTELPSRVDTQIDIRSGGSTTFCWKGVIEAAVKVCWIAWGGESTHRVALSYLSGQLQFRINYSSTSGVDVYAPHTRSNSEIVVVCVADFEKHSASMYLNGALLISVGIPVGIERFDLPVSSYINRFGIGGTIKMHKCRSAALFNRALSAPEIAYLSK